jgi:hypothetical protein
MSTLHAVSINNSVAPVTTAETVVGTITIPPENQPGGDGVVISGIVTGTTGAGTTALVVRVRQGVGTSGAVLPNSSTQQVGAAVNTNVPFTCLDTQTSYPQGNTYSVTVQQTGATGNGSNFNTTISSEPATSVAG